MNSESSGTKSVPVIVQSEGVFNAGIILNESNYDVWSQLMEMHIAEREKLSYIRGKKKQPAESEDGYEKWYAENQKVKRWLLMSMTPEIMKRYLRLPTAHEIWSALSEAFYDGSDELQIFSLNQKAFTAKQNGRALSEYYGELMVIFQELDHRDTVVMKDPDDVKAYHKSIERLRVHIFLAGLDGDFEQVRGEILRKEPVPGLEECHALIRRETVRRATLKGETRNSEAAAMVTRNRQKVTKSVDKSVYKCTHCDQTGHTKDRCYELVGYPEWWDHSRAPKKRNSKNTPTAAVAGTNTGDDVAEKGSALVATTNTCGKALNISTHIFNSAWIIDSGATDHMTFDSRQVAHLRPSSQKSISTANGSKASIIGEGSLSLTNTLDLDTVLVVPSLNYNLLSVSRITTALSCVAIFWPDSCVFKDIQTKQTIGCGIRRGKLYYLDLTSNGSDKLHQALTIGSSQENKNKAEIWLWHRRLGHASFGYLKKLFPSLFERIDSSVFRCDVCELAKSHRTSFPLNLNKSPIPFMVIHSDVWGPSKIPTLGGSRWFVTFIDDCTRMTWLWLMKSKSEVNLLFQKFHKMVRTQYKSQIQVLRSDNGGEYQNSALHNFFEEEGIINQTTCPNTPQQNGVAERKNRHLLEVVRAALIQAHMPLSYWGEALAFAAYSINRIPSRSIDFLTPFKALTDAVVAPTVPNLTPRVFGCVVFVHLHKHQRNKLAPRALRCVFLGYAMHQKGYRCYHPSTQRMFITMDAIFHEELMYFSSESELQEEYQREIQTLDYELTTCDYDDENGDKIDTNKGNTSDVNGTPLELDISKDLEDGEGTTLDLDTNKDLEDGEVIET